MACLSLKAVKAQGLDRGKSIANWIDLPNIGDKVDRSVDWAGLGPVIADVDAAQEYFLCLCHSAESNSRDYSPFEFTAAEFNEADNSEAVWAAFDEGINEGFEANWAERSKEYYK